jgi:hypothetical protein
MNRLLPWIMRGGGAARKTLPQQRNDSKALESLHSMFTYKSEENNEMKHHVFLVLSNGRKSFRTLWPCLLLELSEDGVKL